MNELDIEVLKEKYTDYKTEHYEDEREMRKLLKMKRLVPNIVNEEKFKKDYKRLNDELSNGLYYYNELKKMLTEEELKEFVDRVKYKVMKERYIKFKLNKFEDNLMSELECNANLFEEALNDGEKVIPKVEQFDKGAFANSILEESELIKKVEIICRYQKSTINVFFDTTAIFKAELARLFVEHMNIENVDENRLVTACLVYAFKRTNTPAEIERIKREKEEDKNFFRSLGFDENFCKICSEYNRYNEYEGYERENEGDILELMDKFVALIVTREDRLAFSVEEAMELLYTRIPEDHYNNRFSQFIGWLEGQEISRDIGIVTYLANTVNRSQRHDISTMLEKIIKVRDLLGGDVNEHKVMRLEKIEKIQDKFDVIQVLQKLIIRAKEKIASLSKILRGYKKLSEGSKEDEIYDR